MSAAMFDDPLTIWATAISSIVVSGIVAFAGPTGILFSYEIHEGQERFRSERLVAVIVGSCVVSCIASYLIALGFSERLYRDISGWSRYRDFWEQDLFWFCVMISIPVVSYLTMMFWKINSPK
jgi:hypothetical protein